MWQRFSERARKVVFYAQEEAQKLGDNYVSTEHLLLGLLRDGDTTASEILRALGTALDEMRQEVLDGSATKEDRLSSDMTLTPRVKRVIDLAFEESRDLGNGFIGTEHLLLGLIREGDGLAGRILTKFGVDLDRTRREVARIHEREGTLGSSNEAPNFVSRIVSRFGFGRRSSTVGISEEERPRHNNAIWERCTPRARAIIDAARTSATEARTSGIGPEHLILALLDDPRCRGMRAIASLNPDLTRIRRAAEALRGAIPEGEPPDPMPFASGGQTAIAAADVVATKMGNPFVGTEHLALVLFGGAVGELVDPEALLPDLVRQAVAASQAEE